MHLGGRSSVLPPKGLSTPWRTIHPLKALPTPPESTTYPQKDYPPLEGLSTPGRTINPLEGLPISWKDYSPSGRTTRSLEGIPTQRLTPFRGQTLVEIWPSRSFVCERWKWRCSQSLDLNPTCVYVRLKFSRCILFSVS